MINIDTPSLLVSQSVVCCNYKAVGRASKAQASDGSNPVCEAPPATAAIGGGARPGPRPRSPIGQIWA